MSIIETGSNPTWQPTRVSSRVRMVAGFLVLSLGSLLTLAVLTTAVAGRVITQQANDRVAGTAQQTGLYVGQVVQSEISLVNSYGRRAYIADAASSGAPPSTLAGAHAVLVDLAASADVREVTLIRVDGTTVDSVLAGSAISTSVPMQPSVATARAFAGAVGSGAATVTGGTADSGVLVIAVPVPTDSGGVAPPAGVLAVAYLLEPVQQTLDDFAQTQSLEISIIDSTGHTVLVSPRGRTVKTAAGPSELRAATSLPALGWQVTTRLPADLVTAGVTDLRDAAITVTLALAALCLLGVRVLNGALRQRQTAEERLQHMALHDALTGLPNRLLFADRLERALSLAERSRRSLAIVAIDLNDFKIVNDTLGHQQGDLYLRALATRLRTTLRDSDTAARMGGDEFAVLALDIGEAGVAELTARLGAALSEPWVFGDHRLGYGASIGVAVFPEDGRSADDLMRSADLSMYASKRRRGAGPQPAPDTATLAGLITAALEGLPITDLAARAVGASVQAEPVGALAEPRQPRRGAPAGPRKGALTRKPRQPRRPPAG